MRKVLNGSLCLLVLVAASFASAQEFRLGVIDTQRVIEGYEKAKEAETRGGAQPVKVAEPSRLLFSFSSSLLLLLLFLLFC